MEDELAAFKQAQEVEECAQVGAKKKAELTVVFQEENELTEDMKKLIEKVVVYPGNRIEIEWKFGNI